MATLDTLVASYDVAMATRNPSEGWFVKRYSDRFVLGCAQAPLEVVHHVSEVGSVELSSRVMGVDGKTLLQATDLVGPLRAAVDADGRLHLRGTYEGDWGERRVEVFAVNVLDGLTLLAREIRFGGEPHGTSPLEVRVGGSVPPRTPLPAATRESVSEWLAELGVRHIQTTGTEWQVQTFGKSGVGYTSKLILLERSLIATIYGTPNASLQVDDALVQAMLRSNDRSGSGKLTLVLFTGTDRIAPSAGIEWPASAVSSASDLGDLVSTMTRYLDDTWDRMRVFFVAEDRGR
jgi:hypothetical protein